MKVNSLWLISLKWLKLLIKRRLKAYKMYIISIFSQILLNNFINFFLKKNNRRQQFQQYQYQKQAQTINPKLNKQEK
jgi:hypothetical protein